MLHRQGFTLIEIIVVVIIISITIAFFSPNFNTSNQQARAAAAQNNLLAIYTAQQNYNNNNDAYCIAACNSLPSINTNLSLNIQDDGTYSYSCAGNTCTATRSSGAPVLTLTLNLPVQLKSGASSNPLCTPVGNFGCP